MSLYNGFDSVEAVLTAVNTKYFIWHAGIGNGVFVLFSIIKRVKDDKC